MSIIGRRVSAVQHFFRSGPMPCPYITGRIERKLFTRLAGPDAAALNSIMSQAGFRRSHDILYRPSCQGCAACVPVRIPVKHFRANRSQKRSLKRNQDLTETALPPSPTPEQYALFLSYEGARHADSDMARMTEAEFEAMMVEGSINATVLEYRDSNDRLRAVMLADHLADGYSAVYSFFDPNSPSRGFGNFMITALVERARRDNLDHVYLGYWIQESPKMAYKASYRPHEILGDTGWILVDD